MNETKKKGSSMNKLLIGLALTVSFAAQAQESSSALPAAGAPTTQTSTTTVADAKPAAAKKWGASAGLQAWAHQADVRKNGGGAVIDSLNYVGLSNKLTDKIKVEARHNFQLRTKNDEQLAADADNAATAEYLGALNSDNGEESTYRTFEPTLHASYKSDLAILGAAPMSFGARYYIPIEGSPEGDKHSNGILRLQTSLSWDLNPKINIEMAGQTRLYMNTASNPKAAVGSDSVLRYIVGPAVTYNFNDTLNAYYTPYLDMRTTGHQRGNFTKADVTNTLAQEVGLNITVGPVTINPAYFTVATRSADTEGYKGAGEDENSEIDLNIIGSF